MAGGDTTLHPIVPEIIAIATIGSYCCAAHLDAKRSAARHAPLPCAGGVLIIQWGLQRLEFGVANKPAVREMLRSAYREVLILGLIAFCVFLFELAGSEDFGEEGSGM